MTGARLLFRRSNDPDIVGQPAGDRFKQCQAAGVDAVVVGQQDAHFGPAMRERASSRNSIASTLLLRHIGNIFGFSSSDFAQSLLRESALSIGRLGDDGL